MPHGVGNCRRHMIYTDLQEVTEVAKTSQPHTVINDRGSAPKKIPPPPPATGKPPGPQRVVRPAKSDR